MASWRNEEEGEEDSPPLLRLLAQAGADLGAIDQRGASPMDLAIEYDNLAAIETLWSLGQRIDTRRWELAYESGEDKARSWPRARDYLNALEERQTLSATAVPIYRTGRPASL